MHQRFDLLGSSIDQSDYLLIKQNWKWYVYILNYLSNDIRWSSESNLLNVDELIKLEKSRWTNQIDWVKMNSPNNLDQFE